MVQSPEKLWNFHFYDMQYDSQEAVIHLRISTVAVLLQRNNRLLIFCNHVRVCSGKDGVGKDEAALTSYVSFQQDDNTGHKKDVHITVHLLSSSSPSSLPSQSVLDYQLLYLWVTADNPIHLHNHQQVDSHHIEIRRDYKNKREITTKLKDLAQSYGMAVCRWRLDIKYNRCFLVDSAAKILIKG